MDTKKTTRRLISAASAAILAAGLAAVPAHAGTPWLACPEGTTPVYSGHFTSVKTPDGDLMFQACKTRDGALAKAQVGYFKKRGKPVDLAFGWHWVAREGKGEFDPDYRGDYNPAPGEFAAVSAGKSHYFERERPTGSGSQHPIDVTFKRPKAPFTCLQGYVFGYKDFNYDTNQGTMLDTKTACF